MQPRNRERGWRRRRSAVEAVTALLLISLPCGATDRLLEGLVGPIPLRTLSPLRNLFFQLAPEGADTLDRGTWSIDLALSESNVLNIRNAPPTEFDADLNLEITRFNTRFAVGIADGWEMAAEIPVYRFHAGFLDSFIRDVEELVGDLKLPRQFELDVHGPNAFRYFLNRGEETIFEIPDKTEGLGDVALSIKRRIGSRGPKGSLMSVRAAVKLPTGDEDKALGSGSADVAIGWVGERVWGRWAGFVNVGVTAPVDSGPFEAFGLDAIPVFNAQIGFERRFRNRLAWHGQFGGQTAPFEFASDRGPSPFAENPSEGDVDGEIVEISTALSLRSAHGTMMLGIYEDIHNTEHAASDVTFFLFYRHRSAPRRLAEP